MDFINSILSDRWLPITIVVVSPIIAFIIDFLFSLVFKGIVKKTKTGYKVVNKYTGRTLMTTKSKAKAYARKNKGY